MPRQPKIRVSEIVQFNDELKKMPERPAEEVSPRQALIMLAPELRALHRRNYDWAEIRELLRAHGIHVSESVLKKRVSEAGAVGGRGRKTRRGPKEGGGGSTVERTAAQSPRAPSTAVDAVRAGSDAAKAARPILATTTVFLEAAAHGDRPPATKDNAGAGVAGYVRKPAGESPAQTARPPEVAPRRTPER